MLSRFETARLAYDQFVTELLRRDRLMRESVEYRRLHAEAATTRRGARSTNERIVVFESGTERTKAWSALRKRFGLDGKYCLAPYVAELARDLKPRMGKNELQVTMLHELARRAWEAYEPYLFGKRSGHGRRGRPRRRK